MYMYVSIVCINVCVRKHINQSLGLYISKLYIFAFSFVFSSSYLDLSRYLINSMLTKILATLLRDVILGVYVHYCAKVLGTR